MYKPEQYLFSFSWNVLQMFLGPAQLCQSDGAFPGNQRFQAKVYQPAFFRNTGKFRMINLMYDICI